LPRLGQFAFRERSGGANSRGRMPSTGATSGRDRSGRPPGRRRARKNRPGPVGVRGGCSPGRRRAKKTATALRLGRTGAVINDSGDHRLSRQRHYHGPGGLNGRVRNGNGWNPASMVAGNPPGGRSSHAGRSLTLQQFRCPVRTSSRGRAVIIPAAWTPWTSVQGRHRRRSGPHPSGHASRAASGRGGQAVGRRYRSAAAVARRARPARLPGRLPGAFAAIAAGDLVLKRVSHLDAFSAYPFPT
jgi:hypothetical protein